MSKILSASVKFDPSDDGPEPYAEIEVIVYEPGLPMHLPCQLRSHMETSTATSARSKTATGSWHTTVVAGTRWTARRSSSVSFRSAILRRASGFAQTWSETRSAFGR